MAHNVKFVGTWRVRSESLSALFSAVSSCFLASYASTCSSTRALRLTHTALRATRTHRRGQANGQHNRGNHMLASAHNGRDGAIRQACMGTGSGAGPLTIIL